MLPGSPDEWRRATNGGALSCLLVLVALVASASALRGEPTLASVTFDNSAGADANSLAPSISADGRYVAFESAPTTSRPTTTTASPTSSCATCRRHDRPSSSVRPSPAGRRRRRARSTSSISADGRFVAFDPRRQPLAEDNERLHDVFVRDLQASTTTLVSRGIGGAGADGELPTPRSRPTAASSPSRPTPTTSSPATTTRRRRLRARPAGEHDRRSSAGRGPAGAGADGELRPRPRSRPTGASWPSRRTPRTSSRDDNNGRATSSCATCDASTTTLVSLRRPARGAGGDGDLLRRLDLGRRALRRLRLRRRQPRRPTTTTGQRRVRARPAGDTTTLVSRGAGGAGRRAARLLRAPVDLGRRALRRLRLGRRQPLGRRPRRATDVFVRDLQRRARPRSRAGRGGAGGDGDAPRAASISADGRYVAFASDADNLSPDDNNAFTNVFRRDLFGPPPDCSDVAQAVAQGFASVVVLPCSDADGDPITRSIVGGPAHGALGTIDQPSGTVFYTPTQATRAPTPSASAAPTRAAPPTSPRRV